MRFFLDHDIDAGVAAMLRRSGHQVWTAANAGLADTTDDDLSVYADDKNAALVTHDREFTARRRRNPIGQHVRLACHEWDAAAVLREHLAALETILHARPVVVVVVTKNREPRILEADWRER